MMFRAGSAVFAAVAVGAGGHISASLARVPGLLQAPPTHGGHGLRRVAEAGPEKPHRKSRTGKAARQVIVAGSDGVIDVEVAEHARNGTRSRYYSVRGSARQVLCTGE